MHLKDGVNGAWEQSIRSVRLAIGRRFLKHHIDNLHEVEHVIKLAFWSLKFIDISELVTGLFYSFLDQS